MTDYSAVPDELQELEQWVCWADEERSDGLTKVPKRPDGSGVNASSTDPETWGTFSAAAETARERDWGIGFVFTEDGPYAGIDLDDCLNDRGGPSGWLPSLDPFTRETYLERSPSGDGLHIIVREPEIPEWWTNQHGEDDGREVAVFPDGRFFTFTGDDLDVSAAEVADIDGLDEWLVDAWEAFNDGPPPTSDTRGKTPEPDLSRGTRDRVDVRVTDVVHAGYTPGERHEHPVHGSTTGSNFLVDEDDETFRCWRHDVTGNALHLVGMQEGIISCGDWRPGGLDTGTWSEIFDAARERDLDVPDRVERPSPDEAAEEGRLDWRTVWNYYADDDWTRPQAREAAVRHLLDEHDFMTPRDTESIWVYDPDRGVYEPHGKTRIEELLQRHLRAHYSQHEKREVLGKVRSETYCDRDAFDAGATDRQMLCVANGVLDLEERELLDHSPEYRFTRGIPVEYHPEAEAPAVDEFMDEIVRRPEDKRTMYEMLGNALLPHYDHSAFLVLFGEGANGKSTFFDVVEALLGGENVSGWGLQDLEENRFATSSLPGKFANIAPDLPGKAISQTGTIKALTGGDTMMAEQKGEPAFEFENDAKLMFGANRPPKIQEASMAIKRRILPIHLPRQFTHAEDDGNPDARPKHKLVADLTTDEELSGLLNYALEGADRLRETGQFSLPETPEERLEYYEQFSDPIKEFAINCLANEPGQQLPKASVYEAFKQFSAANDYSPRSREVFFRHVRQVSSFTYNEAQPRTGDGGRQRVLEGATLTEEGVEYCDDLLLRQLGLKDDGDVPDVPATETELAGVDPAKNPFYDVEVKVTRVRERSKGPAYEATVQDDTATLEMVDWEGVDAVGALQEGETYRVSDVKAAYDSDGALHLQPIANTTEFVEQNGAAAAGSQVGLEASAEAPPDPGGSRAEEPAPDPSEDAENGESADSGETDDPRKLVVQLATAKQGVDSDVGVGRETLLEGLSERGLPPDRAELEVDKALREGRLQEPTANRYEPTT